MFLPIFDSQACPSAELTTGSASSRQISRSESQTEYWHTCCIKVKSSLDADIGMRQGRNREEDPDLLGPVNEEATG